MADESDVHFIRPSHTAIHDRLMNWSRVVRWGGGGSSTAPMFRHYRSYGGWQPVTMSIPVNPLDALEVEKQVRQLPEHHRDACRWWYVYSEFGVSIHRACRLMAVRKDTLLRLVHDSRSMMANRMQGTQKSHTLPAQFDSAPAVLLSPRDAEVSVQ